MLRLLALALLALAACEGAEAKPAPATAQKSSAGNPDHDLCVAVITHSRTCTDQYIAALVDARAAADHPAGIRAEVASNRDGVIAQAKQEWATDSTDANIEAMCQHPQPNADAQRDAATACQAQTDCTAFAQCIIPIQQAAWH